jgi:hypothetical protein
MYLCHLSFIGLFGLTFTVYFGLIDLFSLLQESNKISKSKLILGTASLNIADFTSTAEEVIEIILPLSVPSGATEPAPSLHVCIYKKF